MSNTDLTLSTNEHNSTMQVKNHRLDDSLFSKDLAPHYMKLASNLASSDLVPKSFRSKPQDLFICWAMGYQVGLTPEQSMQCIAVINGKPAMWGDDMLALCMAHKDFEDIEEVAICNKEGAVTGYVCTVRRLGKKPKINEFTLDMAKRAGLLSKGGVWSQYPERMLKLRARGFCLRDAFPDALKGIKPREEVEDYINTEDRVVSYKHSRTEDLKQDYLQKTGVNHVIDAMPNGLPPQHEDCESRSENTAIKELSLSTEVTEETLEIHSEIKRLIAEKSFTDARLEKALAYYEVKDISSLTDQSGIDFINQLIKL